MGTREVMPLKSGGQWTRRLGSVLVLFASVVALTLILMDQGSKGWLGQSQASFFPSGPDPAAKRS